MKTMRTILVCTIICLPLIGCIVQSLHPFYTEKVVIDFPRIMGNWDLILTGEEDVSEDGKKPWQFTKDTIEIVDEKGRRSVLKAKYFKVGDTVFVDSTAVDPEEQAGIAEWWALHVIPVHLLCKIQIEEDTLILIPLNYNWFDEHAGESKEIPFVKIDDFMIFTATSEQWVSFLNKHHDTKDVFNEEFAYTLRRSKEPVKEEKSDK